MSYFFEKNVADIVHFIIFVHFLCHFFIFLLFCRLLVFWRLRADAFLVFVDVAGALSRATLLAEATAMLVCADGDANVGFGVDLADIEVKVFVDGAEAGVVEKVDVLVDGDNDVSNSGVDVAVVEVGSNSGEDIFSFLLFSSWRITCFAQSSLGLEHIFLPFTVSNTNAVNLQMPSF